jgi:6-pyruvoyltetrahydropterin/6-carboxytetrahydropterin synthase
MVYDFGLMKLYIKEMIDAFDHGVTLWSGDDPDYVAQMKRFSKRWIVLPVSPSAEQFARVIFLMVERVLHLTKMQNGERDVSIQSIIVHETETGYAQAFAEDAHSIKMGLIALETIEFSPQVRQEWHDPNLWNHVLEGRPLTTPQKV